MQGLLEDRWYYTIRVDSLPEQNLVTDSSLIPGDRVTVLYHRKLHRGLVFPNEVDFVRALKASLPFLGRYDAFSWIPRTVGFLILGLLLRIGVYVAVLTWSIHKRIEASSQAGQVPSNVLFRIAEVSAALMAAVTGTSLMLSVMFFLFRGFLLVQESQYWLTSMTALIFVLILLSPIPEAIGRLFFTVQDMKVFRVVRNLLFVISGMFLSWKLVAGSLKADITSLDTFWDYLWAVLTSLFS